jgi:superfamily I DNA/RNA helicase
LCDIGDYQQAVYDFMGSDSRYLTLASEIFKKFNNYTWTSFPLDTLFRLSGNIVKFLNNNVKLQKPKLLVTNNCDGEKVSYYYGNPWQAAKRAAYRIIDDLRNGSFKPSDVMIIVPSVTGCSANKRTPLNELEGIFVRAGYPCYIHDSKIEDGGSKMAMEGNFDMYINKH